MTYKFTPDNRDPWTQARSWTGADQDLHPQSPAGGGGPGRFTQQGPLGIDLPQTGLHPDAPASSTIEVGHIILCSATTGAISGDVVIVRVGAIYKVEGFINGQPVAYIGSAADLKKRLVADHDWWDELISRSDTKVSIRKVYGKLNVPASGQKTVRSATNEALRVEEEKALRETEQEANAYNEQLRPGEQQMRILNNRRAAAEKNMAPWRERHSVSGDEEWTPIKEPGGGIVFRAFIALQVLDLILDAINQERNRKMSQYITAPTVFVEEDGVTSFTVRIETNWWGLSTTYKKHYLSGSLRDKDVEITHQEYSQFKEEAEALYGYVNWKGDFVPGLLLPKLPVINVAPPGTWA